MSEYPLKIGILHQGGLVSAWNEWSFM